MDSIRTLTVKRTYHHTQATPNVLKKERVDHHVSDGGSRIAIINHWTKNELSGGEPKDTIKVRYQYSNHLGSASLELDESGGFVSYQEYFPFGETAYTLGEVSTEYRFTGKERDEFTGLYYFGARYYAPWMFRWMNPDPSGPVDGLNVFVYVSNQPIVMVDPDGREQTPFDKMVNSFLFDIELERGLRPYPSFNDFDLTFNLDSILYADLKDTINPVLITNKRIGRSSTGAPIKDMPSFFSTVKGHSTTITDIGLSKLREQLVTTPIELLEVAEDKVFTRMVRGKKARMFHSDHANSDFKTGYRGRSDYGHTPSKIQDEGKKALAQTRNNAFRRNYNKEVTRTNQLAALSDDITIQSFRSADALLAGIGITATSISLLDAYANGDQEGMMLSGADLAFSFVGLIPGGQAISGIWFAGRLIVDLSGAAIEEAKKIKAYFDEQLLSEPFDISYNLDESHLSPNEKTAAVVLVNPIKAKEDTVQSKPSGPIVSGFSLTNETKDVGWSYGYQKYCDERMETFNFINGLPFAPDK